MRYALVLVGLVACKKAEPPKQQAPAPPAKIKCEQVDFAASTPIAEASGAAWLGEQLVVVSDSGHTGDYAIVDAGDGKTVETGKLPLGVAGDDIEGLATHGDKLYGLNSSGWMRVWQREGKGFLMVDGPYAIGQGAYACAAVDQSNCAKNYEGLALAPEPSGCAGFACSKAEGRLYCLVERGGRYQVDPNLYIDVEKKDVVADCGFSPDGTLYVGNNLFGLSNVYRIDGWQDPRTAKVTLIDALGIGFPEAVAAKADIIYRMSDTGGAPSMMAKFRCAPSNR
jgi:hypothetical protein